MFLVFHKINDEELKAVKESPQWGTTTDADLM